MINDFINIIVDFSNGTKEFSNSVYSNYLDVEINHNDEHDEFMKKKLKGFLYFPYYLEVNALKNIEYNVYLQQLKNLINFLRSKGFQVVAICDFEDELNDGKPATEFMK